MSRLGETRPGRARGAALLALLAAWSFTAQAAAPDQALADAYLGGRLAGALLRNPHLQALPVRVRVENAVAQLDGSVENPVQRDLALEIARSIKELRGVRCAIDVRADARAAPHRVAQQVADDRRVAALVRRRLGANRHTAALSLYVGSQGGIVTLSGIARSEAEKELAGLIARHSAGVVEVHNALAVARHHPHYLRLTRRDAWLA